MAFPLFIYWLACQCCPNNCGRGRERQGKDENEENKGRKIHDAQSENRKTQRNKTGIERGGGGEGESSGTKKCVAEKRNKGQITKKEVGQKKKGR